MPSLLITNLYYAPLSLLLYYSQDVTSAQLRTLHIAGREGLHAPTLCEFMAAFRAAGCTRPLIVEVKKVLTDRGRMLLLQLLRWAHWPALPQEV
jgi:hypothetical protein